MQGPPDRRAPPILFTRGTSEWIGRVSQKHKQLTELRLSAEQKERLDRWAETEFVYSTLKLEGANVTREHAARVASNNPDARAVAENERAPMALLVSLRTAASLARANGKAAELTGEFLLKLHSAPDAGFRKSAGDASRIMKPVAAEHLPALIESACRWYTAESFAELNPVEQASIVLLRLIDLQPFEQSNERTALVAASLFTLRRELPPIVISPDMQAVYRNALDEGDRMNTKPMVELVAESVERTLNGMLAKQKEI
jgi:Fic family protein